ncbi:putative sugar O-methyltransferase [Fimbriiglobus ruber]|uniref:Sugar O-methyltransferase n=1 Tax=Fimbriiglobus ruber TaxID=1908690 RepID=A0A225DRG7_9BACT|nr:putative sugar O-methyltransferase [Fimbriiglobus ruber]OWK43693.1 hypothetical protein FRUB_03292 [Fimbriiglobus ruber]
MKLGPIHVIRDTTFQTLQSFQDLSQQFHAALGTASQNGSLLAHQVWEHTHDLLHSPLCARVASPVLPSPPSTGDADDREAVERVVAAYQKTTADRPEPPSPSMWDRITREKGEFLTALAAGDVPTAGRGLANLFGSELIWGLGHFHADHIALLKSPEPTHLHYRFSDSVVNLAEAVGAARPTSAQQDMLTHFQPLNRDLDALYAATATKLGFDLSFPDVGGRYGFSVGGQVSAIDSLTHAYTAHRLRQLGAGPASTVYEIGGGYGCLALMARRAGVGKYTIFDLPWVNALQGYFLIRTLPTGTVRLYGETTGDLRVLPYWTLAAEPDKSCDGLVNTDSLPEMGRATAAGYLPQIRRVAKRFFLSINQEAKAVVSGAGEQNCVAELVDEAGGFATRSRQRHWMRQGYVEEVFEPV